MNDHPRRNGAHALIRTLVDSGVDVCFANPGTSEMHFVSALDEVPEMRGVLGLFEGVVTGAADGYARIAGRPAATLLHLGPGLGNGLANLHNARRAHTPVVNIVGDHATYHKRYDAPLESDIDALASTVSVWVRRSADAVDVGKDAASAVASARGVPGGVATLVLPADVSWGDGATTAAPSPAAAASHVTANAVAAVAKVLGSGEPVALLFGGEVNREDGLRAVSRIARATGATPYAETFPTRLERGAGLPCFERLGYLAEHVTHQLAGARHVVLAGTRAPVSFFAYPGQPSDLVPEQATVHTLAEGGQDVVAALVALADVVASGVEPEVAAAARPDPPTGELTVHSLADALGAVLPERAIVVDEANTSGIMIPAATSGAPRHDLLALTGGAIGYGLPAATGAAVAAPDRPVICLESDGSALYTLQALWTQAREGCDVTTILINNGAYAILRMELQRVGAQTSGPRAADLLDLSRPDMDFVALAKGFGVPAGRATCAEELVRQLRTAIAEPGPHLIEVLVPPLL